MWRVLELRDACPARENRYRRKDAAWYCAGTALSCVQMYEGASISLVSQCSHYHSRVGPKGRITGIARNHSACILSKPGFENEGCAIFENAPPATSASLQLLVCFLIRGCLSNATLGELAISALFLPRVPVDELSRSTFHIAYARPSVQRAVDVTVHDFCRVRP